MNKLIVLDWQMYVHKAGYASVKNRDMPTNYTIMNMIISNLKKIGIEPMDEIIVSCDGRGNWRKDFDKNYKANRNEMRSSSGLDWDKIFGDSNELLEKIDKGTSWTIIELKEMEADDIASVACKLFKDKEIVLLSFDSDWEMLWVYPNVKIFSPNIKYKGAKGAYKVKPENFNICKMLAKKIRKEVSDNLVNPILNEDDYDIRQLIVDLVDLPEFVEEPIKKKILERLGEEKNINPEEMPFQTIRDKLGIIYNDKSKVINYEDCVKNALKKKLKKKGKKKK